MVVAQKITQEKNLTPCRNNCVVHWQLSYCTGCNRTLVEIQQWREYTLDQRRAIIKQTKHRDATFFRNQCRLP